MNRFSVISQFQAYKRQAVAALLEAAQESRHQRVDFFETNTNLNVVSDLLTTDFAAAMLPTFGFSSVVLELNHNNKLERVSLIRLSTTLIANDGGHDVHPTWVLVSGSESDFDDFETTIAAGFNLVIEVRLSIPNSEFVATENPYLTFMFGTDDERSDRTHNQKLSYDQAYMILKEGLGGYRG